MCPAVAACHFLTGKQYKIFIDSGVPPDFAREYAAAFVDNEIELDQAKDLTTEILKDLKVKLGHILRILRHVKELK
jgi:hypothetical protein